MGLFNLFGKRKSDDSDDGDVAVAPPPPRRPAAAKPAAERAAAPEAAAGSTPAHGSAGAGASSRAASPTVKFMTEAGEVTLHHKPLETESQLAEAVTFSGVLSETVGLSGHLYSHICPLEVTRGSRQVILLVTATHANSEDLKEVIRLLALNKYKLRPGSQSNLYITASALLLAVAKGQLEASDLDATKRLQSNREQSSLWSTFIDMVIWAFKEKASDIHVNVYPSKERSQIKFTIGGKYVAPARWELPTVTMQQMLGVAYQKGKGGVDATFIPTTEQQCNIFLHVKGTNERVMLRWASMACDDGPQVTMRLLQLDAMQNTISLEQLGYLPSHISMLNRAMKSEGGAIIFAGVVGSGKSTTIATVMGQIPTSRKVMTLEDPREYIIPHSHANTISRPLDGTGDNSFNAKLRTLKRSAFNDLLLGEIRDRETGLVFQDVVLSGQNLYSTTHARRAIGIPDKLSSPMVGVERDALATPGALKLMVYQALLPVNCPHCKINGEQMLDGPDGAEKKIYMDRIHRLYGIEAKRLFFKNIQGCPQCRRDGLPEINGTKGRTVVAEMLECDDQMLELIKDGANLELQRYVGGLKRAAYDDPNMDFKSTLECAIFKLSQGLIDPYEIEPRFASFETIEIRRQREAENRERKARESAASLSRRLREDAAHNAVLAAETSRSAAMTAITSG